MQKYAPDRLGADERPFHKKSQTTSLRLLPRLALVLLVAVITMAFAVQSTYGCQGGGKGAGNGGNKNKKGKGVAAGTKQASGSSEVTLIGGMAILNNFKLSGAPANVGLIIHIHAKNPQPTGLCKGPVLFVIKNTEGQPETFKTDDQGKFSLNKNQAFALSPPTPPAPGSPPAPAPDLSKFNTWYVNVHDATKPLPIPAGSPPGTKPKFQSIACGLISAGSDPTVGNAKMKPEEAPAPAPNTV